MRKRVVVLALVSLANFSIDARQAPTPVGSRTSDAVLAGGAPIALPRPSIAAVTAATAERVLQSAGVRYGFEGVAFDPARPGIDLAQLVTEPVAVSGKRLGEVLDMLARAEPTLHWSEADGIVTVRTSVEGTGVLDRRIAVYAVQDATSRAALDALVRVIDPDRPKDVGVSGFARGGGAGAMGTGSGAASVRKFSVSLTNTTVRQILQAIAKQHGALSWTIHYDATPASVDSATIALVENGDPVTATSPAAQRRLQQAMTMGPARGRGAASGQQVLITTSLAGMLSNVALTAIAKLSVEELPSPAPFLGLSGSLASTPQLGLPPLDLTGLGPADAIARVVALDSRYEWSEDRGRFHVRPKAGTPGRITLLDKPVGPFVASNEPASAVIDRVGAILRGAPPTVPGAGRSNAPIPAGMMSFQAAMEQSITVSLPAGATVRDAYDAIADATGWSWTMRPQFTPGQPSTLSFQWRGPSWMSTRSVVLTDDLAPAPMPTRAPDRIVPAALDLTIERMSLSGQNAGQDTISPFDQLSRDARVPMGIELLPAARSSDPRIITRLRPPVVVGPGKFSDALYLLLERETDYAIVATDAVINVAPKSFADSSTYFMNRPIDRFDVRGEGIYHAVGRLGRMLEPSFMPQDWMGGGADSMNKPLTLSMTRATPREILDRLVREHGGLSWVATFESPTAATEARAEPAAWVITLVPLDNFTLPARIAPVDGRPAATGAAVDAARQMSTIQLDLPATPERARSVLGQLARTFRQPLGIEIVYSGTTGSLRGEQYYDLGGLPLSEAVDKIISLLPSYGVIMANGVLHFQEKALAADPASWLNRKIGRVEQHFDSLRDAQNWVANLGVTAGRGGSSAPPIASAPAGIGVAPAADRGAPPSRPDGLTDRMKTNVTLTMPDATIRDVLDEIARQAGTISWSVDHRNAPTRSIALTFTGFDGWSAGMAVR